MFDLFKYRSKQFSRNSEQVHGDAYPCVLCGKPVEVVKYKVHLHRGGSHLVTEDEAATLSDDGDMGMYPLGENCYRRCLREGIPIARYVTVCEGAQVVSPTERIPARAWPMLYADLYRQVFGETIADEEIRQDARKRLSILTKQSVDAQGHKG